VQGFAAPYYGERLPIPTLEVSYRTLLPLRIVTALGPETGLAPRLVDESADLQHWEIAAGPAHWRLELARPTRAARRTLLRCSAIAEAAAPGAGRNG
jgi:hypothetical protein